MWGARAESSRSSGRRLSLRVWLDRAPFVAAALVLAPRSVAPASAAATRSATPAHQSPKWTAPRRDAGITLRPLWRSDTQRGAAPLTYPIDLTFADQGLAIYDHGERHVQVVDAATGRARFAVGSRGPGPGEFGDYGVTFFGPSSRPLLVEFGDGRVVALEGDKLSPIRVPKGQRWSTGCQWERDRLLLQVRGFSKHDNYVVTIGDAARIVDSIPAPWPRHRDAPIPRSTGAAQAAR